MRLVSYEVTCNYSRHNSRDVRVPNTPAGTCYALLNAILITKIFQLNLFKSFNKTDFFRNLSDKFLEKKRDTFLVENNC